MHLIMMFKEKDLFVSQKPFKILGIEHIGVAMENTIGLSSIFSDIFGLEYSGREEVKDQQVITEIFNTGRGKIELLQATNPDSPISRYIEKKGIGLHHIALIVDNIQKALAYFAENDIELIDITPRIGAEGFQIAFLHPKSTGGILIELCEKK